MVWPITGANLTCERWTSQLQPWSCEDLTRIVGDKSLSSNIHGDLRVSRPLARDSQETRTAKRSRGMCLKLASEMPQIPKPLAGRDHITKFSSLRNCVRRHGQ